MKVDSIANHLEVYPRVLVCQAKPGPCDGYRNWVIGVQAQEVNAGPVVLCHVGPHVNLREPLDHGEHRAAVKPDTGHPESDDTHPCLPGERIQSYLPRQ